MLYCSIFVPIQIERLYSIVTDSFAGILSISLFCLLGASSCNYDYIEFRDGGTENSDLIGRYCGTSRPSTVKSTDNVMYARFRTDNSVPRAGFKALIHIGN